MTKARFAAAAAAVVLLVLGCTSSGALTGERQASPRETTELVERLIVISISGLRASDLRNDALPTLSLLARQGAVAERVRGVGAPLAYPAHATLVTGRAPDRHGVVADWLLGKRGVRNAPFWHATRVMGQSLWQSARLNGIRVAAIGWPSTVGVSLDAIVPDLAPLRGGETWLGVLEGAATPELLAAMKESLGDPAPWPPANARDRARSAAACAALRSAKPPGLMLLRLEEPASALQTDGIASEAVDIALRSVDARVAELVRCLRDVELREGTAIALLGDRGFEAVHTRIDPNVLLAEAGWIESDSSGLHAWVALVRTTDSLATVHAETERAAVSVRSILEQAAGDTRAFRVVPARELQERRGDPRAWFGLEAEPGYVFGDATTGPLLRASERRAAGSSRADDIAFALVGAGVRERVTIPEMSTLDVAPTLATLIGVPLDSAEGRVIVGIFARQKRTAAAQEAKP